MSATGFWYHPVDKPHDLKFVEEPGTIKTVWNPRDNIEKAKIERAVDWVLNAATVGGDTLTKAFLATHPGARIEQPDSKQSSFWQRLLYGQSMGAQFQMYYGEALGSPGDEPLFNGLIVDTEPPDQKDSNVYSIVGS